MILGMYESDSLSDDQRKGKGNPSQQQIKGDLNDD